MLAFAGLKVTVLLALKVVKLPAAAVVPPILILLILPAVAGLIVTTPEPVGARLMLAFAGLKLTVLDALKVVKLPAAAVVPPIAGGLAK